MPFSTLSASVLTPRPESCPKQKRTIGDHIRAWRIDNHLCQSNVSKLLGVCEETVVGWEMRNTNPAMRQMPGIIQLLGYLPIGINTSTFGGRITMYRYKHGITPKELGLLVSADASTVRAWEAGKNTPHKNRIRDIVEAISISKGRVNSGLRKVSWSLEKERSTQVFENNISSIFCPTDYLTRLTEVETFLRGL